MFVGQQSSSLLGNSVLCETLDIIAGRSLDSALDGM